MSSNTVETQEKNLSLKRMDEVQQNSNKLDQDKKLNPNANTVNYQYKSSYLSTFCFVDQ